MRFDNTPNLTPNDIVQIRPCQARFPPGCIRVFCCALRSRGRTIFDPAGSMSPLLRPRCYPSPANLAEGNARGGTCWRQPSIPPPALPFDPPPPPWPPPPMTSAWRNQRQLWGERVGGRNLAHLAGPRTECRFLRSSRPMPGRTDAYSTSSLLPRAQPLRHEANVIAASDRMRPYAIGHLRFPSDIRKIHVRGSTHLLSCRRVTGNRFSGRWNLRKGELLAAERRRHPPRPPFRPSDVFHNGFRSSALGRPSRPE